MNLYEAKDLWSEGSQMTTTDSNHLSILPVDQDIDILDETGEIRMLGRRQGPQRFFVTQSCHSR